KHKTFTKDQFLDRLESNSTYLVISLYYGKGLINLQSAAQ
ncbi:peptidase S8, partial [Bacillus spizizenii]|nr:peptidase S8 [Bacillus spizizenii]